MAPRDLMNSTAMDTVFGNLGMEADDLGIGNDNLGDDLGDDGDLGGDDFQAGENQDDGDFEDAGQDDDPFAIDDGFDDRQQQRVTHTRDRQRRDQRQDQRQLRAQDRQQPGQKFRPDAKGNILNASGQVVARAGKEARIFWQGETHRKAAVKAEAQLRDTAGRLTRVVSIAEQLKAKHDALEAQQQAIRSLGVSPEDQVSAIQLFTQLKKDAKGTLTKLLTRAAANGITIDGSGPGNNQQQNNVADIVKEVLGTELKPLKDYVTASQTREQQQQRDREAKQAVQAEVETWFGQNPDARPYASVFQQVLRNPEFSSMSLGEIWARIQLNQARNPRRGLRTRRDQFGRETPRGRRGSPPIGRSAPPVGNSPMANVNESWDSIVREVLDSAGV